MSSPESDDSLTHRLLTALYKSYKEKVLFSPLSPNGQNQHISIMVTQLVMKDQVIAIFAALNLRVLSESVSSPVKSEWVKNMVL